MSTCRYPSQSFRFNSDFLVSTKRKALFVVASSDVVETIISETETWLQFRDETETETLSHKPRPRPKPGSWRPRPETSHFSGGN